MAEKRMFSQKITDADAFQDLPLSAQALYFHICMHADDDGFMNCPKKIARTIGASETDLAILIEKRFLLPFDNGLVVVKHWLMHNTVRQDRYHPTDYQEELAALTVKSNRSYTERTQPEPARNQTGAGPEPEGSPPGGGLVADWLRTGCGAGTNRRENGNSGLGLGSGLVREEEEEDARARARLAEVMSFYMDRINPQPSPLSIEEIKTFLEGLEPEVIIHAMQIAIDEKKTSWSYIKAILRRYRDSGLTTLLLVEESERQAETRKAAGAQRPAHITTRVDQSTMDRLGMMLNGGGPD